MKELYYKKVADLLVTILPKNWDKAIFSLLIRDCQVNGKQTKSKEFQCKCVKKNTKKILDLVAYSDDNFEVQDIFFEMMDIFYELYNKSNGWNFIMFKLECNGGYSVKTCAGIDDKFDNKIIVNTVNNFILEE